jgi:hypothetical protein
VEYWAERDAENWDSKGGLISMATKEPQQTIPELVEKFRQSTVAYYSARDGDDFKKQETAGTRVNKIIEALDSFGAEGRLALIPLLGDTDQGVRTFAAADLLKVIPERAIAVLKEIASGPTYFPRITAGNFLDSYAKGKWPR